MLLFLISERRVLLNLFLQDLGLLSYNISYLLIVQKIIYEL